MMEAAARSAASWPEPDMSVLQVRKPPPDLPADVFGPYWHYWLKRQAETLAVPIDYLALALLTTAASLVGNARWVSPWTDWSEPPVIWGVLVGLPSSGKTPATDPLRRVLARLEDETVEPFEERLRHWEALREAARLVEKEWLESISSAVQKGTEPPPKPANAMTPDKPVRPRLLTSDSTTEAVATLLAHHHKGLLLFRDELGGWLRSFGRYGNESDRAFWLETFGRRPFVLDRVKHPAPVRIPHLSVCVLGGIQPDVLGSLLLRGDDDGLASRFLFAWPEPVPPKRPEKAQRDSSALDALRQLRALEMEESSPGEAAPKILQLSETAADLFDGWRQQHHTEVAHGRLAGWWGKSPGIVLRLSLILELLWWSADSGNEEPKVVSSAAVGAAATLIEDYFKPMAERAFGSAALPPEERDAAAIANWVLQARPEVLNTRELRRDVRLPGLTRAEEINRACVVLEEAGWLKRTRQRYGDTPGRYRSDYVINPTVFASPR
jgi:hypothetical protein